MHFRAHVDLGVGDIHPTHYMPQRALEEYDRSTCVTPLVSCHVQGRQPPITGLLPHWSTKQVHTHLDFGADVSFRIQTCNTYT
jgi:hypothetical protein